MFLGCVCQTYFSFLSITVNVSITVFKAVPLSEKWSYLPYEMMEQVEDKEDVYLLKASDYSYAADMV